MSVQPREAELLAALGGTGHRFELSFQTVFGRVWGSVFLCRRGGEQRGLRFLLLHGVAATAASWVRVVPDLAEFGECAVVDLLGHGRSVAGELGSSTLPAQTWLVPALLDALGWDTAILVGHSMGGGACLGAALAWPRRIAGLILVASVAYPQPVPPLFWPAVLPGASTALAAASRIGLRLRFDQLLARELGYDARSARDYLACLGELRQARSVTHAIRNLRPSAYRRFAPFYRQLRQPALLVHGTHDHFVPCWVARRLAAELPDARLHLIERACHIPQETHAADVMGAIGDFLAARFGAAR